MGAQVGRAMQQVPCRVGRSRNAELCVDLSTPGLRACFAAAVASALPGYLGLGELEREAGLDVFW